MRVPQDNTRIFLVNSKYVAVGIAHGTFSVPSDGLLLFRTVLREKMSGVVEAAATFLQLEVSSAEPCGIDYVGVSAIGGRTIKGANSIIGDDRGEDGAEVGLVGAVASVVTLLVIAGVT